MFGSGFLTQYAENDGPPKMWVSALSRLSWDQAKKGLANLADDGHDYPPNLTVIMEACRRKPPVRYLGAPSNSGDFLPKPGEVIASKETVREKIAKMREMLNESP